MATIENGMLGPEIRANVEALRAQSAPVNPNILCKFGDSLIDGTVSTAGYDTVTRACRRSKRYIVAEDFAAGGKRTDQFITEQLPSVLAAGRSRVVFNGSTNDVAQLSSAGDLDARANIAQMIATLSAAGIHSTLLGNFPNNNATQASLLAVHELWRVLWCLKNGVPNAHVWPKLATATGAYISGYNVDGTHPSAIGMDIAADELLSVLDQPFKIPQIGSLIDSAASSDILQNAVSFGGVGAALPTGYAVRGTGATYSVEAPVDGSFGNWLKASFSSAVTTSGFDGRNVTLATLGWNPGDKIAVAFRVKTVATDTATLKPRFAFTGSASVTELSNWNAFYDDFSGAAGEDMQIYFEAQISAAATTSQTIRPTWSVTTTGTGTQSIAIQRPLIYNLTLNGLA